MELDKSLNQSPQGGLEKIDYMSSNGPLGNCCKVPNKYLIGYVLGGQNEGSTTYFYVAFNYVLAYSQVVCLSIKSA